MPGKLSNCAGMNSRKESPPLGVADLSTRIHDHKAVAAADIPVVAVMCAADDPMSRPPALRTQNHRGAQHGKGYCGGETSAISALSALAWVRQSNTFGWAVLLAPDQRSPSWFWAFWSLVQMLVACWSTNA